MHIEITRGRTDDSIRITRADGSVASTRFPKKGPFPHDLVHVVVEDTLGLRNAFWGLIAGGRHPEEIGALASSLGHSSAAKAHVPDPSIIELIQAERLVECFEAEIWSSPAALEDLQSVADAAFSASLVPRLVLSADDVAAIRERLSALQAQWNSLPPGGTLACDWA
jgi:hypothetical protein